MIALAQCSADDVALQVFVSCKFFFATVFNPFRCKVGGPTMATCARLGSIEAAAVHGSSEALLRLPVQIQMVRDQIRENERMRE